MSTLEILIEIDGTVDKASFYKINIVLQKIATSDIVGLGIDCKLNKKIITVSLGKLH